jgi:hypothetical protein
MMKPTPKHPTEVLVATETLAPYRLHGPRAARRSTRRGGTRRRAGVWRALFAAVLVAGLWTMPAQAQTLVVEATNADEEAVLQVNDDGGLLGLGVFGTGVIPAEGAGEHRVTVAVGLDRAGALVEQLQRQQAQIEVLERMQREQAAQFQVQQAQIDALRARIDVPALKRR